MKSALTNLFSQELKVRMKTGVQKGGSASLTSGGAAWNRPLFDLSLPSAEVVADTSMA